MAPTLLFLLQLILVSLASASHYFAGSATSSYLGRNPDGTFKVQFRNKETFDGCNFHLNRDLTCYYGDCGSKVKSESGVIHSSTNAPSQNSKWCETETVTTRNIPSDKPFQMGQASCCWIRTLNNVRSWRLTAAVDLGTRSDTREPNKSPDVAILPFLRVPKNCPRSYNLMAFDPDGDQVRFRYGLAGTTECHRCSRPAGFQLDEDSCILHYESSSRTGVYGFELMAEDFPRRPITLNYTDGSQSTRSPLSARRKKRWYNDITTPDPWYEPTTDYYWYPTTTAVTTTTPWWWRNAAHTTTPPTTTMDPWWTTTTPTTTPPTTTMDPWWTTTTPTTTPPTTTMDPWWTTTTPTTTPPTTTMDPWWTTTTPTTTPPTTTTDPWWTTTTSTTTTTPPTTTMDPWWTTTTSTTTPPTTTTDPWWTTTTSTTTTTTTPPTTTTWPTTTTTWPTTTTTWPTTTTTWPTTTTTPPTTTTWPTTTTTWPTTTTAWTTTTTTPPTTTTRPTTTQEVTTTGLFSPSGPLSKLPLQFSFLIDPPAPSCREGDYLPQLVDPTPANGQRFQAEVNKEVEFRVKAQAKHATINDVHVSGPLNITKHKISSDEYAIRWTPVSDDKGHDFPICFAAESVAGDSVTTTTYYPSSTHHHHHHDHTRSSQSGVYQSEMRCVVVKVQAKTVKTNVICHESTMTIEVEKASLSGIHEDHLRLSDPSNTVCSLQEHSNNTHIIAVFPLNACGTQIEEDDNNLKFKNEITTVDNVNDLITRKNLLEVQFYCQYPKRGNVTLGFNVHRNNVTVWEKGFGTFTYEFEFYQSSHFRTKMAPNSYPLEYDVGERIYMDIEATSTINNTELFVESCRAAPYDNPNYKPTYSIIENGCKVDETTQIHSRSHENHFGFSLEAFKFIGMHDQVYISCSVMVCEAGNPKTRCSQGCTKSKPKHSPVKREAIIQSARHFVSQGPLRLKRSTEAPVTNLNLNLVFIAGCLLAALGMISAVIIHKNKTKRVKYQPLSSFET